jgi:hypothetical protein
VFLRGSREEPAHAVRLPISRLLDLGQGRSLGPPDQFQDLCALALGPRRAGFLGGAGFAALTPVLPSFFREALALPLARFWPLGRALLREVSFGATCAPCSAAVAAFSVIVASVLVIVVPFNPFCA